MVCIILQRPAPAPDPLVGDASAEQAARCAEIAANRGKIG
jgi:hypothetical protein